MNNPVLTGTPTLYLGTNAPFPDRSSESKKVKYKIGNTPETLNSSTNDIEFPDHVPAKRRLAQALEATLPCRSGHVKAEKVGEVGNQQLHLDHL